MIDGIDSLLVQVSVTLHIPKLDIVKKGPPIAQRPLNLFLIWHRRNHTERMARQSLFYRISMLSPFLLMLSTYSILPMVLADFDGAAYDEYVKEVLEEDQYNDHSNEYYHEDSYYEDREAQQRLEQERIAQEEADRVQADRERVFQAELDRMSADQQAAALKQKKLDAKVVHSVLKAAEQNELYKVLGIRNWDWKIPGRELHVAGLSLTIPGLTIKETTMKDIRKAYRTRAMAVHPDKNKDGRAQEAFIVVEETASILSDQVLREQYDRHFCAVRRERRQAQLAMVSEVTDTVWGTTKGVLKAVHTMLGPFATPVIIIGALIA